MDNEWSKFIEELEKEGISPKEANRMIRTFQVMEIVMKNMKETDIEEDSKQF
ncbi:hypothetical protein [Bacillus weihaiensis]|uniref:hypothetical protein n=1 Tax=Bacillus weihaiensis TaxID=1547283 RepID=UPI0013146858|nr:hypothetical protein [Bacillus weihaiensis]